MSSRLLRERGRQRAVVNDEVPALGRGDHAILLDAHLSVEHEVSVEAVERGIGDVVFGPMRDHRRCLDACESSLAKHSTRPANSSRSLSSGDHGMNALQIPSRKTENASLAAQYWVSQTFMSARAHS